MAFTPSIFGLDLIGGGGNLLTRSLSTYGLIAPEWGIFDRNGSSVVKATNVESFDYKTEYMISDYPLERGAFESYDKVQIPFEARIRFTAGGSFANRQALINSIAAIVGDLKLYDVVTPEATYISMNIIHADYSRSAQNGAGLVKVDVWLQQVSVTASSTESQTGDGSAAVKSDAPPSEKAAGEATKDGGQVQPQQPTAATIAIANAAIAAGA